MKVHPGIKTRFQLSTRARGTVVELGVAAGDYSEVLLQNPHIKRLYSIDMWANDTRFHTDEEYLSVVERFQKYNERSIVIRRTFKEAAALFQPVFDFIYLDGYAHTGQDDGQPLKQWWPLLKSGGIFAGHDYHGRWPKTIEVVNAFAAKHSLSLYITEENPDKEKGAYPSWWVVKP